MDLNAGVGHARQHVGAAVTASVIVVEDHPVFRLGLARAIQAEPDLQLGGTYTSLEEVLDLGGDPPDVVVLDLNLPGMSGIEGIPLLRRWGARVLVLSAAATAADVIAAIEAGAAGYLVKDAEPSDIVHAVRTVAEGGTHVSPTLASYLLDAARPTDPTTRLDITDREREILVLVAQGERDEDIATQLYIGIRTVRSHLEHIRDKTGRRRRPDLTRYAYERGLLSSSPAETK